VARIAAPLALALLVGCPAAHSPRRAPAPLPVPLEVDAQHDEFALAGVVHVVRRGETMWRIARAYGIDAADLMETNGISDPRAVAVGTELFVPGATRVVEVVPADDAAASTSTPSPSPSPTPIPTPASTTRRVPGGQPEPPLAWPLEGVLYGRYGVRAGRRHDGIDIAAPEGTPVLAAADGTVIYAGEQSGYGSIVILRHANGLVTLYAHNSRLLVEDGDRVSRGQPIARVGQTGRTTGPHLHFEVRQGTRPKNPLLFLP
jgi:murein DD-endopeptidase MepM/ murein hydrolase activator NlpD